MKDLTKVFPGPQAVPAVDAVSFAVAPGEFFSMLGPSGCGKTTTLRMIAGLEDPTAGEILFRGEDFSRLPPSRRNIGMVFQSYALFPHMTVFHNVAYGLRTRGQARAAAAADVTRILGILGLEGLRDRYPSALSGGQQQRVSIARAMVYQPAMLLLDEPLANLDAKLRVEMREEIRRVQRQFAITTLYVTHDQEEAMSISDRVAVFGEGRLLQVGDPPAIYNEPASLFVADFVGKVNFAPCAPVAGEAFRMRDGAVIHAASVIAVPEAERARVDAAGGALAAIRPEKLRVASPGKAGLTCQIKRIQFLGSHYRIHAQCASFERDAIIDAQALPDGVGEGQAAALQVAEAGIRVFTARRDP